MLKYILLLCFPQLILSTATDTKIYNWEICPSERCNGIYEPIPIQSHETFWLMRTHNFFRNKVALQGVAGHEGAANMHTLSFKEALHELAQCQANVCTGISSPERCKQLAMHSDIGYNVFTAGFKKDVPLIESKWLVHIVRHWFEEFEHSNRSKITIDNYQPNMELEQFSQLIWAKSKHIGCGRTRYRSANASCLFVNCMYLPAGNIEGKSVYKTGKPCSQCSQEDCNEEFKGLCGKISYMNPNKSRSASSAKSTMHDSSSNFKASRILICKFLAWFLILKYNFS